MRASPNHLSYILTSTSNRILYIKEQQSGDGWFWGAPRKRSFGRVCLSFSRNKPIMLARSPCCGIHSPSALWLIIIRVGWSALAEHPMCNTRNPRWRFSKDPRVWIPEKEVRRCGLKYPTKIRECDSTEGHGLWSRWKSRRDPVVLLTFQPASYLRHSCGRSCLSALCQCGKCTRIICQV